MKPLQICKFSQISLVILLIPFTGIAQDVVWTADTARLSHPNFGMDSYHEVLHYNDPLMHLVLPIVEPVVDRKVPLEDGEGKDGYWLEGTLAYRFSIYKGKYYSLQFCNAPVSPWMWDSTRC